MTDTSGAAVERYVYDPYGKVTIYDDDWSDTVSWANSEQNEILYCGYRFDPESGLYHVRNRMYHTTLGRWMQRDPKGYVDGMGLYEYCCCGAVNRSDPFGLDDYAKGVTVTNVDLYIVSSSRPPESISKIKEMAKAYGANCREVSTAAEVTKAIHDQFVKNQKDGRKDPKVNAVIVTEWKDNGGPSVSPAVDKEASSMEKNKKMDPLFGEDVIRGGGGFFGAGGGAKQLKPEQITKEVVDKLPIGPALKESSQVTFIGQAVPPPPPSAPPAGAEPSPTPPSEKAEKNYDKISEVSGCRIVAPRGGGKINYNYDENGTTVTSEKGVYDSRQQRDPQKGAEKEKKGE